MEAFLAEYAEGGLKKDIAPFLDSVSLVNFSSCSPLIAGQIGRDHHDLWSTHLTHPEYASDVFKEKGRGRAFGQSPTCHPSFYRLIVAALSRTGHTRRLAKINKLHTRGKLTAPFDPKHDPAKMDNPKKRGGKKQQQQPSSSEPGIYELFNGLVKDKERNARQEDIRREAKRRREGWGPIPKEHEGLFWALDNNRPSMLATRMRTRFPAKKVPGGLLQRLRSEAKWNEEAAKVLAEYVEE
ncbi:unnamed protein product [Vitrella brassicaformis CCMP3155]|uniref:Uncharacterized protein n=2 Tax=Vitrella brassicaformis TaxID=1169539 RepID=A0A0G4ERN4_VITBC|nr:unnamed protein product [Vitrella brassicaformis CCMP3155]|mmetsp:Transcript_8422/g.20615  ORF Transcript_8422/g.20615 Transcript_8422/m.20615 type:complete len:240 (+) Transcript_8422:42-761(+)|eukprot:CEL99953.1 unnamed protein product [Vitrella brassicaformis CCMP3155]